METIIDIVSGMKQSEFISAINNNFRYLNSGAEITYIDASNSASAINTNFANLNAKLPFQSTMVEVANSMKASDYISAIQGNFAKIKANQTLKNTGAKLIIRFDDGYAGQYTGWYPLLESLGVKGTIAALAQHYDANHSGMTSNNNYFSWSRAIEMIADGWDIEFHGLVYTDIYGSKISSIESTFATALGIFNENGIFPQHHHVHSSNNYNPKTIALQLAARRYFKSSNLWIATPYIDGSNIDVFNLGLVGFDGATDANYNVTTQTGLDSFHSLFLSMVGTNRTSIIAGHDYSAAMASGLTAVINDAKNLGIEIVTMNQWYNALTKV